MTCEKKQIDIWYNLLTEYFCCCNFVQFTVSVKKISSSELRILGPELMYGLLEQIGQALATRLIFRNSGLKYELKTTQSPHGAGNLSLRWTQLAKCNDCWAAMFYEMPLNFFLLYIFLDNF